MATSDLLYKEVSISSAQILSLGTLPVELLSAPGGKSYYVLEKVILEYHPVTTQYTFPNDYLWIDSANSQSAIVHPLLITNSLYRYCLINTFGNMVNDPIFLVSFTVSSALNQPVYFTTWASTDPTLGDGTMKVKIWYSIKTMI